MARTGPASTLMVGLDEIPHFPSRPPVLGYNRAKMGQSARSSTE